MISNFYASTIVPFIFGLLVAAAFNEIAIYWQIKVKRTPRALALACVLLSLCLLYLVPALALSVFWREVGHLSLFVSLVLLNYFDFRELRKNANVPAVIVATEKPIVK